MTEPTSQPNEEPRPPLQGPAPDFVDPITNPDNLQRVIRGLGAICAAFWLSVTAVAIIVWAVIGMVWLFPGEPTFAG